MTMLADLIDAVVGGDTHRYTHTLELVAPKASRWQPGKSETMKAGIQTR